MIDTLSGTRADVRGLPPPSQDALLLKTFQLLRPGRAMEVWLDREDDRRHELERQMPGRFTWTRESDRIVVRRVDGANRGAGR